MTHATLSLKPVAALAAFAAVFAHTTNARAFTVTASNVLLSPPGPNLVVVSSTGIPIPVGQGVVGVGYFLTLTDAQIASCLFSGAELSADFRSFGPASAAGSPVPGGTNHLAPGQTTPINGAGFSIDGAYSSGFVATITGATNLDFSGKTVYTFIGDGPTWAASTEGLIFKHNTFTFAADPTPGVNATLLAGEIPPGVMLLGNPNGPLINVGFGLTPSFQLGCIPEPSRALLLLVGLSAAILRRRQ